MKAILFLAISAAAFSANAIQTIPGSLGQKGTDYSCSFTNGGDDTLDIKYATFTILEQNDGAAPHDIQVDVNRYVSPGETISVDAGLSVNVQATSCGFVAR